jgi:Zn-dependent protease with chaperone function
MWLSLILPLRISPEALFLARWLASSLWLLALVALVHAATSNGLLIWKLIHRPAPAINEFCHAEALRGAVPNSHQFGTPVPNSRSFGTRAPAAACDGPERAKAAAAGAGSSSDKRL